jgi:hypothetical protein
MGYELNRLMAQYGVGSPASNYMGTQAPLNDAITSAKHQAAYEADRAAYEAHHTQYIRRMNQTPMYAQEQFGQASPTWSSALAAAPVYQNYAPPPPAPPAAPVSTDAEQMPWASAGGDGGIAAGIGTGGISSGIAAGADGEASGPGASDGGGAGGGGPGDGGDGAAAASSAGDSGGWYEGGMVDLADKYALANPEGLPMVAPQQPSVSATPLPPVEVTAQREQPAPPQQQPGDIGGMLQQMLQKYTPQQTLYSEELRKARATASTETAAFNKLIERALAEPSGDAAPSKSELYFRLAAAFGAPTKTGHFAESVAAAGKEAAEHKKSTREAARASRAEKLQLGITAAKTRMDAARDDVKTLQTLTAEEMKDSRALIKSAMEQYIKSGQAESTAGKQATDEGLRPGTPEFQARVREIAQSNIDQRVAQIQGLIDRVGLQQAQLQLAQQQFLHRQTEAARLSPAEAKLRMETEDELGTVSKAMGELRQAFALNPDTFNNSLAERGVRFALENTKSNDPRVVATRTMENLLRSQALSKLKQIFPGAISNDERKALEALQGLDAVSRKERENIILNAYQATISIERKLKRRMEDINRGVFRETERSTDMRGGAQ